MNDFAKKGVWAEKIDLGEEVLKRLGERWRSEGASLTQPNTAPKPEMLATLGGTKAMTFDEAISRFRMLSATIPSKRKREMFPILIEKMKPNVFPEDRDAFETIAMSFIPDEDEESDAMLKRLLPLMIIMSMLRRE